MAWRDLIDVMRTAAADAERAGRIYREPSFRAELRIAPDEALRRFELARPQATVRTARPAAAREAIAA